MTIQAVDKTFSDFLNPNEPKVYKIPTYQREYSWKIEHCEELINDINDNENGYFIGSVIWITNTNEIIDGQQRLTSLSLLLLAIFNKMNSFQEDEDLAFKKSSIKRMLVIKETNRLVPQKQGKNEEDYQYLITYNILKKSCAKPNNFGNRRISKNYLFFEECISKYSLEQLIMLFEKICTLKLISAQVDDVQTAFVLFETMNNRGMELSAIDLIKNSYMSKTHDVNSIDKWETLVNILGNESNQEQFLRNNYNAFRKEYNDIQDVVTENTKYGLSPKATKSNVISIYNKLVTKDSFMDFITMNAKYNSLLTGEDNPQIDVCKNIKEYFKKFRTANATSAFIILLYLLRKQVPYGINDSQFEELLEIILRFFIRRNLTNNPSTGALPQILMDIIAKLNSKENVDFNFVKVTLSTILKSKSSSDSALLEILKGDIYDTNRDMARYLLCSLCNFDDHNERRFIDLWEKNDGNKYIWTIEHILPEGNKNATNTPKEWIDMIKNGDAKYTNLSDNQVKELIKKYRHRIGNLTMTGYNSNLGNKSFNLKKNRTDEKGNNIGYNNGLSLNDYVYAQDAWCIKNIEERTEDIVSVLMENLKI